MILTILHLIIAFIWNMFNSFNSNKIASLVFVSKINKFQTKKCYMNFCLIIFFQKMAANTSQIVTFIRICT